MMDNISTIYLFLVFFLSNRPLANRWQIADTKTRI